MPFKKQGSKNKSGMGNKQQVTMSVYDILFSGKKSAMRTKMLSKRIEQSSRGVIGPDQNLDIDEVGVPIDICKILTKPEVVTKENINQLQIYVANKDTYPGATFVEIPPDVFFREKGKITTTTKKISV